MTCLKQRMGAARFDCVVDLTHSCLAAEKRGGPHDPCKALHGQLCQAVQAQVSLRMGGR